MLYVRVHCTPDNRMRQQELSQRAHTLQLASIKSIIHACILSIYLSLRFTKTFLKEAASFNPLCWTASLFLNEGGEKNPGFLRAFYFTQTFLKEERTFSFVSFIHTLLPLLSVFTNTLRLQTYRKKLSKEIEVRWILHTSKTIKTSTFFLEKNANSTQTAYHSLLSHFSFFRKKRESLSLQLYPSLRSGLGPVLPSFDPTR